MTERAGQFILQTWKGYKKEYLAEQKITIRVEHGTELKGVLEGTLTLTPDKFWLVSNSFKIGPTGSLIIRPGVHLKIVNYSVTRIHYMLPVKMQGTTSKIAI